MESNEFRINFHRIFRILFALSNQSNRKFSNPIESNEFRTNSNSMPPLIFRPFFLMSFSLILLGLYWRRPSATSFSPALHALALALFSPSSFKTRSSTKASKAKSTTSLEKRQFEWVLSSARSGCVWSVYVLSVRKDQRHGPSKWTCLLVSKNKGRLGLFFQKKTSYSFLK